MRFIHMLPLIMLVALLGGCVSEDYPPNSCGGVGKAVNPELKNPPFEFDASCLYRSVFDNPSR